MSAILIYPINPISCNLIPILIKHDRYGSMLDPCIYRTGKQLFYLIRRS